MIESKEVNYAKELDDVLALIEEIIVIAKSKGDYTELMDELISAITGVQDIKGELVEDKQAFMATVGLRIASISSIFIK